MIILKKKGKSKYNTPSRLEYQDGIFMKGREVMPKLTEKQERFCEEYLIDLNATQSYLRAGYKAKSSEIACSEGSKLLRNPKVAEYIQELREKQSKRTEITADKVLEELGSVAFNREIECIGRDKVKALELIGQHLGMFTEKVSITKEEEIPKLLEALKEKSPTV